MKKYLKKAAMLFAVASVAFSCTEQPKELHEQAEELQRSILTWDTHADTPMRFRNKSYDISKDNLTGCIDVPKMRQGSLDVESFAIFTWQGNGSLRSSDETYVKALDAIDLAKEIVLKNSDIIGIATTPAEMLALKKSGKATMFLSVENSYPIGKDIKRAEELYSKGVRMFGLVHSYHNDICDSSSDSKPIRHNGLSEFGKELVVELNRLGAIVDISHASDSSFFDVVKLSKTPVLASHSSVRKIAKHDRNFSDDMLFALKENGGVIQICILDKYVKNFPVDSLYIAELAAIDVLRRAATDMVVIDSLNKVRKNIRNKYPEQNAYITDYVDHIDYVVNLIGIDHVGIGTDFDGGGGIADCKDASDLIGITEELLRRDYSKEDIAKIWSGNSIRVFNEVIEYSKSVK